jgi:ATP-binding cassette, subfamily B, bacterial
MVMFGRPAIPAGTSSADAGLPFAGIPSELRLGVEKVTADEPAYELEPVPFSHRSPDDRPLTLRSLFAPHRRALVLSGLLVVVETTSLQAGPLLTKVGIDSGIAPHNLGVLLAASIGYVAVVLATIAASGLRLAYTGRVGQRLLFDLRVRVFAHQQRLSLDFYTREKAGVIMTRMTSDIEALNQLFQDGLVNLAVQGLTIVIVVAVLFSLNVRLAIVTILAVIPALTVASLWYRRSAERGYLRVREGIAFVLSDLAESLAGMRVVSAYNRQLHNIVHHRNVVGDYRSANDYTARANALYGAISDVLGLVAQVVILVVGGLMVLHHQLTIGELTAFVLYLTAFFAPIQQLVQFYNLYQQGRAAIVKLRAMLLEQPSVLEAEDAYALPPISGEIELADVSFGYDPASPILHGVDLRVAAGETFSLVGSTGAGKSTIAKLVTRFYDPTAGRVLIDGHDLRDVTLESLRSQIGVVPQEPYLFSGTIRENVAFGRPEASDEEVMAAVAAVGLAELVDRVPGGIHHHVHERGASLSSGERQLIALARTFLAQPRVVILDEATSNLDLRSEAKVERALDVLLEGRTAIIITHRLATAVRADRIAVVEDGRLAELAPGADLQALFENAAA